MEPTVNLWKFKENFRFGRGHAAQRVFLLLRRIRKTELTQVDQARFRFSRGVGPGRQLAATSCQGDLLGYVPGHSIFIVS